MSDHLARNLFYLCDRIGPRFAGTTGYRQAAEYMLARFNDYGLARTHLESFTFNAWRRGPTRLTLVEPIEQPLACYALPYSASTPDEGVHAEVVTVGGGTAEEIDQVRERLAGRFAIVMRWGRHRMDIYDACVKAKAAGFIFAAAPDGMGQITGSATEAEPGAIPAISIGREDALKLARLGESSTVRLHLITQHRCEPDTTWNVIGELPGTDHPDELIIVGGHLDSHDIGPGAYDNCAGAVQVMEIARLLAERRRELKRTVRFIGFAAEEIGLLGSKYHAAAHAGEWSRARAMFNSDMPALCSPWRVGYHACPQGESVVAGMSAALGIELTPHPIGHGHSDHYPFTQHGVPALSLTGSRPTTAGPRFAHMAGDTPEKIPLDLLAESSELSARIVLHLTNTPPPRR